MKEDLEEGVVGKGFYKMDWLLERGFQPHGNVLELGGGTGGFTQRLFRCGEVKNITTLNFENVEKGEAARHNRFKLFDMEGERKFKHRHTLLVGDFHGETVLEPRGGKRKLSETREVETLISDMGESKSMATDQLEYSRKKRREFEKLMFSLGLPWKDGFAFLYKELCSWDPQFLDFCKRYNLRLLRVRGASLASTEVYAVRNGKHGGVGEDPRTMVERLSNELLALSENISAPNVTVIKRQVLKELEHWWTYVPPPEDRLNKLKDLDMTELKKTIEREKGTIHSPENKYRSVEEIGLVRGVGDSASGQHYNSILKKLLAGHNNITGFMKEWGLTDVTAAGTFRVYDQKVDTSPVENHRYREIEMEGWEAMATGMKKRMQNQPHGGVVRPLTYEEAVARLREGAATGMNIDDSWKDDPELEKKVREELQAMRDGKPKYSYVNTMGKREKKKVKLGTSKGSRLISYFPIVTRICEQMILGDLLDKLSVREVNPMAVGHMNPVDYFSLMADEQIQAGRPVENGVFAVTDDIAGWDTRMSRMDLEREADFFEQFAEGQHKKDIIALYRLYSHHWTLLKRPAGASTNLCILEEKKGRLSGTIATYVGNTITNTNKTLTHFALSAGVTPHQAWKDLEDGSFNAYVSGDDKVLIGGEANMRKVAENTDYWTEKGYLRKDLDPEEPSRLIRDFSEVNFCSHRPIKVSFEVGERDPATHELKKSRIEPHWCPTRPQSEILAKAVYSIGGFADIETEAAHALQIRNYLVQYVFHRDIRKLIQAITRVLPDNIVPMGKMIKPRYLAQVWMDKKDLQSVCKKVFSTRSKYPVVGLECLEQMQYVRQKEDILWGSTIHHTSRKTTWIEHMHRAEKEVRDELSKNPDLHFKDESEPMQSALRAAGYDLRRVLIVTREQIRGLNTVTPSDFLEEESTDYDEVNLRQRFIPNRPTLKLRGVGWFSWWSIDAS